MPDTIGSSPATSLARQGNSAGSAPSERAAQALEIKVGLRVSGLGPQKYPNPTKIARSANTRSTAVQHRRPIARAEIARRRSHRTRHCCRIYPVEEPEEVGHVALTLPSA